MEPKKPFYTLDEDVNTAEVAECLYYKRSALSGPLGQRFGANVGARSEEEYRMEIERQQKVRAANGGLPDSSPEMPPEYRDDDGMPFKF